MFCDMMVLLFLGGDYRMENEKNFYKENIIKTIKKEKNVEILAFIYGFLKESKNIEKEKVEHN